MTVSDPGAGQQQGREVVDWRVLLDAELERMGKLLGAASVAIWPHGQAQITVNEAAYAPVHNAMGALGNIRTLIRRLHPAPSPTPPARDSGRLALACPECGQGVMVRQPDPRGDYGDPVEGGIECQSCDAVWDNEGKPA